MIAALALSFALAAAASDEPVVAAPEPAPTSPPAAAEPPPPAANPGRRLDDLNKPLMGGVPQGRYEAGVAGAFAASENLQGPLDGAWFVAAAEGGRRLFRFQFADPGYSGGKVEGAWRDLRAGAGAVEAGGFVSEVAREGDRLVIRLSDDDGRATVLTLEPRGGGGFGGQLAVGAATVAVVMARP